jgi:hypothetical protein
VNLADNNIHAEVSDLVLLGFRWPKSESESSHRSICKMDRSLNACLSLCFGTGTLGSS